jgi:hypothetical protein
VDSAKQVCSATDQEPTTKETGKKEKREKNPCDGAQGQGSPLLTLGCKQVGNKLKHVMDRNNTDTPNCPYMGPRQNIQNWEKLGADPVLLQAIKKGAKSPLNCTPAPKTARRTPEAEQVMTTIGEYLEDGTIRTLTQEEENRTRYWVPVFGRKKKDSTKIRLITDLRDLNNCHNTPKHKAETWDNVLRVLSNRKLTWGITMDIKGFFHHLEIHKSLQRWMRFCVWQKNNWRTYQITAMPFGWGASPWWANKLTKPIKAWLNQQQWEHCWWVDDILLLGETKQEVEDRAMKLVELLTSLGIRVNKEKCMTQAQQQFQYIGHNFNLGENHITPIQEKVKITENMIKHQMKANTCTASHVAALAGNLGDAAKSNMAIQGLPQQIMRKAAQALKYIRTQRREKQLKKHWYISTKKPEGLKELLQKTLQHIQQPTPRIIRPSNNKVYTLRTDACNTGWGAQLCLNGKETHTCAQKWDKQELQLHITHQEAKASALAVEYLLRYIQHGSKLQIETDATSTAYSWKKGSKLEKMNLEISKMVTKLAQKRIHTETKHIPGVTNKRADWLSRNTDPKCYRLLPEIFNTACKHFHYKPTVDLFASRDNKQVDRFCSWRVDKKSLGNAFGIKWTQEKCWLNPPWELITKCLQKVQEEKATALVCFPLWQTATWWRTLLRLQLTKPLVIKDRSIYHNPSGERMPPPHWATIFTIIQG